MIKHPTPTGTDNVDFKLVEGFKGYNSALDPTDAPKDILVRGSQNVYRKLSGTVANRPGLKLRGSTDNTVAGVKSSWEWYNSSGGTLPLRVANGKLQFESDIVTSGTYVWYTLLSSLTTTAWVFDAWWNNSLKTDVLLFVGGSSSLYTWSGGVAKIASTTSNTIVLDRTVAASRITAASGSVIINGNTYTYSGSSGSTLTGVSGDPTGEANGSVVVETVITNSNQPASSFTNDFLKVIDNHVYVGSYTSRLIYVSKTSSYTDYTQSTPRIPGDGELITLDDVGKGIGVFNKTPMISAGTSLWYEVSFSQITVGTTLSEQTKVSPLRLSGLQAALRHEFIDSFGNDLVFLDQNNQLRMLGNFRNIFEVKFPSLSIEVQEELADTDFTGGHIRAVSSRTGAIVYITAPLSGTDYMFEVRQHIDELGNIRAKRFWHPPQIRGISRYSVIGGLVYGHSAANPQLYKVWDTNQWYDDSPDGEQLPYNSILLASYRNAGRPQGKINFDKLFAEGYMTPNSEVYAGIYYDYQGATGLLNPILNSSDNLLPQTFIGSIPPSLGDASLGDNPLGSGVVTQPNDQALVPKFKVIVGLQIIDCFEYALMIYSQKASARWEILKLGVNPSLAMAEAVEIVKSN